MRMSPLAKWKPSRYASRLSSGSFSCRTSAPASSSCVFADSRSPGDCTFDGESSPPQDNNSEVSARVFAARAVRRFMTSLTRSAEALRCKTRRGFPSVPGQRKLAPQPGARHGPFALHRGQGDPDHAGRLLEREPAEVAQLHDAALRRVDLLQSRQ